MCQPNLNAGTNEQSVQGAKWCCFDNCNRFGLLLLAWLKLVLSVGLLYILTFSMNIFYMFGTPQYLYHVVFLYFAIFMDVVDIIIGIVTVISIHVKYQRIMEIYYMYSIYIFGSITVLCCLTFFIFSLNIGSVLILLSIFFLFLLLQIWLNYTMKKEVLIMRSNELLPL